MKKLFSIIQKKLKLVEISKTRIDLKNKSLILIDREPDKGMLFNPVLYESLGYPDRTGASTGVKYIPVIGKHLISGKKIYANVISRDFTVNEVFLFSVYSHIKYYNLTLINKSDIIKKTDAGIIYKVMELLSISKNSESIDILRKTSELPVHIRRMFNNHKFDVYLAGLFFLFKKGDQESLEKIFNKFKLSYSNKRELMEWLIDICRRDNRNLKEILKKFYFEKGNDKDAAFFLDYIYNLRFPEYSSVMKKIRKYIDRLSIRNNLSFKIDNSLETKKLECSFKVENLDEFTWITDYLISKDVEMNVEKIFNNL